VKAGKLRMLAVASPKRDAQFPDVPTVSEVIGKEFDAGTLFGVLAPAGTPRPMVMALDREISRSMSSPEMMQVVSRLSANPRYLGPAEYAAQLKQINQRMGVLIKQNGLTAE
jgi:tripartite-type tricarboxylate transporter receptor subunit TctC